MKYDLRLRTISGEDVLEVLEDRSRPRVLCKWRDRNVVIQEWLEGRLTDSRNETVILTLPRILKESKSLSFEDKQYIADWIIYALFPHPLHTKGEDVLHETLQVLLFDVLIANWPRKQNEVRYQDELYYTLQRWFSLVNDPQRSWFERTECDREDALKKAVFVSQSQIYPFYALPGFDKQAGNFARWFLGPRYDVITCTKIHACLSHAKNQGSSWWKKLFSQGLRKLFGRGYWWTVLLISLLLIFLGLFLPLSANAILSPPMLAVGGGLASLLLVLLMWLRSELILPRMLGAIAVGYILLLITAEAWEFAFRVWQNHRALAFIIFLSSLVASFLYLVVEMGNKVYPWRQRFLRSVMVSGVGFAQSLLVGIVSCLLIGAVFMTEVLEKQEGLSHYFTKFQLHLRLFRFDFVLYPEIVLFFAPVALFVGIFSQILWEEKEITSPL